MHALICLLSSFLLSPYGLASPIPQIRDSQVPSRCDLPSATLPQRGSAPELPSPPSNLRAKHVVLGVGTQNYTCTDGWPAKPVAIGALASLFDLSCVVGHGTSRTDEIAKSALAKVRESGRNAANKEISSELPPAGEHYFINATPFFDFRVDGVKDNVFVSVAEQVPPPKGDNTNAVDWLQLTKEKGVGVEMIYRVETLGGKAPETCEGKGGSFEIPYVAQYWTYG